MKLLLDTHIWLWSLNSPERVAPRVLHALKAPGNEVWLSPISAWEALVLHAKGKINLGEDASAWFARATAPLREAPLTHEIVWVASRLALPHRDPADRFLLATARVLGLTLITADASLLKSQEVALMANQ